MRRKKSRDTRARSYQFAQVLELMQQNEQKEQFFMVIRNSRTSPHRKALFAKS